MARISENKLCTANIFAGETNASSNIPCRVLKEGFCLKDIRVEQGYQVVRIDKGLCWTDVQQGIARVLKNRLS